MSGGSKQQTVGYRYRMGVHMGICLEADSLMEIRAGDRTALAGEFSTSGTYSINVPQLFGGDEREGGLQGEVDIMLGRPDQGPNAYLTAMQGGHQPGHRGWLGLVYRGLVSSNNPYIKNWEARVRSILKGWNNDSPWYPERASIPVGSSRFRQPTSLYIALDVSGSMGGSKMLALKQGMQIVIDQLVESAANSSVPVNVRLVAWSSTSTHVQALPLNAINAQDLRTFVDGLVAGGGTNAEAAFGGVQEFMTASGNPNRVVVCVSDGAMTNVGNAVAMIDAAVAALGPITMRGVGIETAGSLANFDNSGGPIPVIDGDSAEELAAVILDALSPAGQHRGMNPAHIIYQAITDPDWGMGYPPEMIDDANFRAAADRFHAEGLGLGMKWVNQTSVRAFTQAVADHASLNYGQSRTTGRFEIMALRQDYDVDTLPVFTKSNSRAVSYQRPAMTDTVNEIIIEYTDVATGKDASTAPLQNLANIMAQGRVVSQKLTFPGIPNNSLATRVGMRELQSRSTPLWKMKLEFQRGAATHLAAGKPFVVDYLDTPMGARVVMRAVEINFGKTANAMIVADCVEDVFGMPSSAYVAEPVPEAEAPDNAPKPATATAFEVPYIELVQTIGQAAVNALPPDAAYVAAAAIRPAGVPMNFSLLTRLGTAEYLEAGVGDFAPSVVAADLIPREIGPTVVPYSSASNLSAARVGDAVWIGEGVNAELARLDAIDTTANTVTLGRGCGDTLPRARPAGTRLWIFDQFAAADTEQYVDGETVNAKVVTNATGGQLDPDAAAEMTVPLVGRAARPYLPANLRVNGAYYPTDAFDVLVLTWVHRDRATQADLLIDQATGSTGLESGATYSLTLEDDIGIVVHSQSGLTGETTVIPNEALPLEADTAVLRFWTERDGLRSMREYAIELAMPTAGGGDMEFKMDEPEAPISGGALEFNMGASNG